MKKTILACLLVAGTAFAQQIIGITSFSSDTVGDFPKGWRNWPGFGDKVHEVYRVKEEGGNKFLSADDSKDYSGQIFRGPAWYIKDHPLVTWRWRAQALPPGANESSGATNDSACGVYIMFSQFRQYGIKYVWSSTLPVGTIHAKIPGKMYFIVLDSGKSNVGKWRSHTVNILEDYKKAFGSEPPSDLQSQGIGILTDGNAVHARAACDYDDFARMKVKTPDAAPATK
ncbi:MAG: hypothetical protein COV45_04795 [Deltaproteobacteria bacterium CG11_big_fil_rev_8_21_14_0_20_47_16]|nr:MAG: hypothetical protein COV45_04795 [Deltaproteobacteria bacterium CG11_big_fil_rev_8_21_14_0_20_47_16]